MAQAVRMHFVSSRFTNVDATGKIVDKNDSTTTIKQVLASQHKHLVIPDPAVPNSAGYPTVQAYLALEAASGYVLFHLDQSQIVTYHQGDLNAATVA